MSTATLPLPCDGDGICMRCHLKPPPSSLLTCSTCATPWHVTCLPHLPPPTSDQWDCPDCSPSDSTVVPAVVSSVPAAADGGLVAAIRAIEADARLSDVEKARKRQELLGGKVGQGVAEVKDDNEIMGILGDNIKCSFCMQLPDRPVTTPCGHNFCLKCFEKWVGQGKKTCAKCRKSIPASMASQPRINSSLVFAIRAARTQKPASVEGPRVFQFIDNDNLPDEAFTTERAVKAGKANAKSGKIFVTIAPDHLGPITAEYDPVRKTGVLVGDSWSDRLACRQWGAHFPHVSGIAGQSKHGAQSVVLSGGYEDDEDHGEWFIYTGSGGRDLSGNKRTNKEQSSDQKFTGANESLRLSCYKGYPVRVVRSYKEKRSNYAPETGVRYDGIYRIEKCWLKLREQDKDGKRHKVCRYLFVRCDNSPAPWTSDEHGDRPRPLPKVPELKQALQLTGRKDGAHWDFDEKEGCWKWIKPAPSSKKTKGGGGGSRPKKSSKAKILKEFSCLLCHKVLTLPITTPCAHNFCKACLDNAFEGQKFIRERQSGGRQLRTQKTVLKCPSCPSDLSGFLQNAEVNRELMGVIESLLRKFEEEEKEEACQEESCDTLEEENEDDNDDDDEDAALEDKENTVSDSVVTETIPVDNSVDEDEAKPAPAKRGRKRKNAAPAPVAPAKTRGGKSQKDTLEEENENDDAALEDKENTVSDPVVTETIPVDNSIYEDEAKPAPAKRGRKRKNAAPAPVAPAKARGRKSQKDTLEGEEDENEDADADADDEDAVLADKENTVSDPVVTETIPVDNSVDENEAKPVPAKRGRKRKNAAPAPVAAAKTRGRKSQKDVPEEEENEVDDEEAALKDKENTVSAPVATETIPVDNSVDENEAKPAPAKRGRKRKNAAVEDKEDTVSAPVVTETIPVDNSVDENEAKPAPAKRGRKKKNAAAPAPAPAPAAPAKTRGRKSQKARADDGNDSPSSPLHVPSDNDLE